MALLGVLVVVLGILEIDRTEEGGKPRGLHCVRCKTREKQQRGLGPEIQVREPSLPAPTANNQKYAVSLITLISLLHI